MLKNSKESLQTVSFATISFANYVQSHSQKGGFQKVLNPFIITMKTHFQTEG